MDLIKQNIRINSQIRAPQVRLIDTDGAQIGILSVKTALEMAMEKNLDLVEVSPEAKPPVCRILDFGKYRYEQAKKAKEARKKQHTIQVKEVKLRPVTDEHDYQFLIRHARNFLEDRDKVKIVVVFRGRENTHKDLGTQILARAINDLGDISVVETPSRFEGKNLITVVAPR